MPATKPNVQPDPPDLNETLIAWKSPSHPYKKREPLFYQTLVAIAVLLSIVVFFLFHDILMIGVIVSVVFLVYALSKVEPVEVEHKITRFGFDNVDRLYKWIELYAFWFEKRWNHNVLVIQTRLPFPGQIRAVVSGVNEAKLKDVLGRYLLFSKEPIRTWMDRVSIWLSKKIPLETTS